ncbi:MAG: dTDP-glucose 4,6-dehydratase [Theionarchaea archaeon]|nr:dTDP-glucose 4,6-dehydratase [Theionarchaea archaeon]
MGDYVDILVTGGCGFIGSNFIRYMLEKYPEYHITNLDKLTYAGNLDNLRGIEDNPQYTFVKGDICDRDTVKEIIPSCDIVINFAAESHVDRSITGPEPFVHTDVVGTFTLLEAVRQHDIIFVQISTDEVYGSLREGAFREDDPLKPNSPYSASKASADLLVRSYYVTYGLPVLITRSSNNFGPYQHPEKLIPKFTLNALQRKPLTIYGTGENVRDWIYVLDNCTGIDTVVHRGSPGEVYNIGGGNERTNLEITHKILEVLDRPKSLMEFVEDRKGHDFRYALNIEKMRELGWNPHYNFEEALEETVFWYRDNEWWWRPIPGRS